MTSALGAGALSPGDTVKTTRVSGTERPQKLGRYELLHQLTRGGVADVLLGQQVGDAGFRKLVVLKRVASQTAFDHDTARQMLIREARLTAGFVHSNIAQVYDLEQHDGAYYLAMEFVPGVTLIELLQRTSEHGGEGVPPGLSLSVARDVAEALHYAHTFMTPSGRRQAVIHRDVAHKNVMLRWDGVTKLLDFGLVKRLGQPSMTREGLVKGTVDFMSPEQLRGEPLDGRSDVFSLGVMLYELLARAPITTPADPTPPAQRPALPPISSRAPGLPKALDAVLAHALHPDRAQRTLTARDFSRELSRACGELMWEAEAISDFLKAEFEAERAAMEALVAKLAPDEVSAPGARPLDADRRTELVSPEQIRAALSAGPPPPSDRRATTKDIRSPALGAEPEAATTDLKSPEEIRAALHDEPAPATNHLKSPEELRAALRDEPATATTAPPRRRAGLSPALLAAALLGGAAVLGCAAWLLSSLW